jgi:hypothetical protein
MNRYALLLIAASMAIAVAQKQPAKAPIFEVASVRPNPDLGPPGDIPANADNSPGHFVMRDKPLRMYLEWAYDLKDYQISGPEWIKIDERYDITAMRRLPPLKTRCGRCCRHCWLSDSR